MITQLRIKNYALIEHLEMTPAKGLSIITGETGAGKSIMLGAVGLLLGKRVDTKVLFNKEDKCVIEGEFDLSSYELKSVFDREELDYELISIFRREISPSGKSRAFINDTPVTLEVMRSVGKYLMNVHSQHQTLELGNKDFQLQLIDNYADNNNLLNEYSLLFHQYKQAEEKHNALVEEQRNNDQQSDYETFLLEELDKANFKVGEQENLEQELAVLENAEEIKSLLFKSAQILADSEFATLNGLQEVRDHFTHLSKITDKYTDIKSRLESVYIELKDLSENIVYDEQTVEVDPEKLLEVQERLGLLFKLQQKHNVNTTDELIVIQQQLQNKLERRLDVGTLIEKSIKELEESKERANAIAKEISNRRLDAFTPLKRELELLLSELGMENSMIDFDSDLIELSRYGIDSIQLKFSANKGVVPQPIKNVASGGELSRLMFCIKYISASKMALPTLVFDEIDAGISGEIAIKMGKMMKVMANNHQVITITHLPQMASYGEAHYYVYKDNDASTARSKIRALGQNEREFEIAKMIGGEQPSSAAFESAKELLINSATSLN